MHTNAEQDMGFRGQHVNPALPDPIAAAYEKQVWAALGPSDQPHRQVEKGRKAVQTNRRRHNAQLHTEVQASSWGTHVQRLRQQQHLQQCQGWCDCLQSCHKA